MKLQTEVDFPSIFPTISLDSAPLFIGSCFAERIGGRLADHSFPKTTINPLGIAYDPVSIAHQLRDLSHDGEMVPELFQHEGLWRSWAHHSRFAHADKGSAAQMITKGIQQGRASIQSSTHIFLTLGTAWVHRLAENGEVVANRHKVPADRFMPKLLMGPSRIVEVLSAAIAGLPKVENRKVILSVSPIRHIKEGAVDNAASKGALLHACHTLCATHEELLYLPTYELMTDELRDYRFYAEDMVHPSPLALDIIWERFLGAAMSQASLDFLARMAQLKQRQAHRLLHPESSASIAFSEKTLEMAAALQKQYPFLAAK